LYVADNNTSASTYKGWVGNVKVEGADSGIIPNRHTYVTGQGIHTQLP